MADMLSNLIRLLSEPAPRRFSDEDARHALAALLVRVARTDGYYSPEEAQKIDRILATRYGMSPFEATALRRTAEEVEAQAPDTVRFTRTIKDAVPYEDRLGIIEALWQVVMADGQRDAEEDALLRLVSSLLGVSDLDSNMARRKAAEK